MIQLTRLRHGEPLYLNPDLFERVATHVDTVVRLTNGHEYVVAEAADEIARRVVEYRALVLGLAVALPAVMGYNWLTRSNRVLTAKLDAFAFELFAFLSSGQTLRTGNQSPAENLRNLSLAGGHDVADQTMAAMK